MAQHFERLSILVRKNAQLGVLFEGSEEVNDLSVGFRGVGGVGEPRTDLGSYIECGCAFRQLTNAAVGQGAADHLCHDFSFLCGARRGCASKKHPLTTRTRYAGNVTRIAVLSYCFFSAAVQFCSSVSGSADWLSVVITRNLLPSLVGENIMPCEPFANPMARTMP